VDHFDNYIVWQL